MTQRNQDQDKVFTGPAGSQGKPAADMVVLVDGSSTPVRLGEALQTAGSDVNSVTVSAPLTQNQTTGAVTIDIDTGVDPGDVPLVQPDGFLDPAIIPAVDALDDLANDPDTTTGLTYGYKGGKVQRTSGSGTTVSSGTIDLTDDAENEVYVTTDGDIEVLSTTDLGLLPQSALRLATVTTAAGEITNINDRRVFLNNKSKFFQSAIADGGFASADGLDLTVAGSSTSELLFSNSRTGFSGDTITLADDAENFVEIDPDGSLVANISDFVDGNYPVAIVTTAAGEVTDYVDKRPFASVPAPPGLTDFAQDTATTTGLDYGYKGGRYRRANGGNSTIGAGTITLADDSGDNVVYIDAISGQIQTVNDVEAVPFGAFWMARITTAAGEVTAVTDRRAFANAFGEYVANELAVDLKITQGDDPLDVDSHSGLLLSSTGLQSVDGQTITLTDDATNYVEISVVTQGDVVSNTTGFTKGAYPLAQVTTAAGVITELLDKRPYLTLPDVAPKVVTTQFDKTNDTTLANVPGLTFDVQAGVTYTFEATLFTVSNVGTGVKAAIGGTSTADTIIYEGTIYAAGISVASGATRTTTKGNAVASLTATTVARIDITGTIVVAEPGTLTVQFAENTAVAATVSSVLINSKFSIHRVG